MTRTYKLTLEPVDSPEELIWCRHCNANIPRARLTHHLLATHAIPSLVTAVMTTYTSFRASRQQQQNSESAASPKPGLIALPSDTSVRVTTFQDSSGADETKTKMSTTFSAWQAQNQFVLNEGTRYITADDLSAFRVDRSNQPQMAARILQKSAKYDIRELVTEFKALASEDRERCNDLIGKLPVFACLSAHVFTHLKLCAPDKPHVLDSFLFMTQEWIDSGEEWCLVNFQTIKTGLTNTLRQSQTALHNCNQQLLGNARLHHLDVHSLAALLVIYSTEQSHIESFYAMKDDQAQATLDLLQELIDLKSGYLDSWYKRRFLDTVVRLSRKSRLYPHSLIVSGVDRVTSTSDRGGSGAIFRGELSGRVVALKELQTAGRVADAYMKDFCQEAVVWRNVHHRNCLPFYGIINVEYDGLPRKCLVSPWMKNGNLAIYLSHNPDVPRLPLLLDIASGLEYLHAMQPTIVHGDLKSLNIFITDSERACLADFGLATVHDRDSEVFVPTTVHGIYGTAGYMAPELISLREDPNGTILLAGLDRRRCDMFALGCITYEVYTGGPPFRGNNPTVRSQALLSGLRPHRPTETRFLELGLDDDMWLFIESLWAHRPEARLVATSARDFLRYKISVSTPSLCGVPRPQDDPEWDPGFLGTVVVGDVLSLALPMALTHHETPIENYWNSGDPSTATRHAL